jgi:hypothetical protein
MATFTHSGPFNSESRQQPALKFLEKYIEKIDTCDLFGTSSTEFYSSIALFRDTNGQVHVGGDQIWNCLTRFSTAFTKSAHHVVQLTILPEADGKQVVHAEFLTDFWLRGEDDELHAPRFFVFVIGKSEVGTGTDGLQFEEVKLFWDTGIVGRFVTEMRKRSEKSVPRS